MHKVCVRSLMSLLFVFGAVHAIASAAEDQAPQASLYERLGGIYPVATVVDDFIERLLVNDVLNANPVIEAARHSVPKAGLKYQVTAFVAEAMGGPEQYAGTTMKASHAHLNISNTEWAAMLVDFDESLKKFKVPEKEQAELVALLESVKGDIITRNE